MKTSTLGLILLSLGITYQSIYSDSGLLRYQENKEVADKFYSKALEVRKDIDKLNYEIQGLQDTNYSLEKLAREDLGYSKEGEIVYVFKKKGDNGKSN